MFIPIISMLMPTISWSENIVSEIIFLFCVAIVVTIVIVHMQHKVTLAELRARRNNAGSEFLKCVNMVLDYRFGLALQGEIENEDILDYATDHMFKKAMEKDIEDIGDEYVSEKMINKYHEICLFSNPAHKNRIK